jgi:hypothetical protein
MNDKRSTLKRVDEMMTPGKQVHTLIECSGLPVLLGANWDRKELLRLAKRYGAYESGESANAMHHGIVVWNDKQPVFCETRAS